MAEQETVADVLAEMLSHPHDYDVEGGMIHAWASRAKSAHTRELEALRARIEALQEYKPMNHKNRHAKTGYVAFMAHKAATCEGEEYGWISKGHVLAAIAAQETGK